ncbi:MAG: hypothetical protein AB1405_09270 [Bdellovibrionota bacterium]
MSQVQFTVISKGTGREKYHLVINVGGPAPEYCLVFVVGAQNGQSVIQDAKQARFDDVKNYLLDIFRRDTTTTTLSCAMPPSELVTEKVSRIFQLLAARTLGVPPDAPVGGLDRVAKYMTGAQGKTAWGEVLQEVRVDRAVKATVDSSGHQEEASVSDLMGRTRPPDLGPKPTAKPAPKPAAPRRPLPDEDEGAFDSLLGDGPAAAPAAAPAEQKAAALPKLEKLSGVEGKLVFFTARYSKILSEFGEEARKTGPVPEKLGGPADKAADLLKKLLKDVTAIPPEFHTSKNFAKVPSLNSLYIRELHFNLPEFKEKSKSEIVRLLSMELTQSTKKEPESLSVQFLYKARFDLPPDLGDPLRDLLRFSFGKPVQLEENFPYITRKVDLTKLYYKYTRPEGGAPLVTDIFCFRELDGRAGLVYLPYDYLGTGVMNQLVKDFFARPWTQATR